MTVPLPRPGTERCELSDLPVDQCGCRKHRPGVTVVDLAERHPPHPHTYEFGLIAEAQYESPCAATGCGQWIRFGERIVPQRYMGHGTGRWAHEECAREAS